MQKIAFSIQKGGTGKSSMSGNAAAWLAQTGRRVCLIDGDPQGNISSWLLGEFKVELADVLQGRAPLKDALQYRGKLAILPTFPIGGELKAYSETRLFQQPFRFDDLNAELEGLGFEYVIYDLSPGMSQLERCILLSCDEVITPLTPEFFSADGLEIFRAGLDTINRDYRRNVQHRKVIANNVNMSFAQHRDRLEWFKTLDYQLYIVPTDRNIADAQAKHATLFEYAKDSRAAGAIQAMAGGL